jgi:hypothetical protein
MTLSLVPGDLLCFDVDDVDVALPLIFGVLNLAVSDGPLYEQVVLG